MLYQQLKQVRGQLRHREVKLSDALLMVFRYLQKRLPAERLIWMNRELLGYRQDDLVSLYEKPKVKALSNLISLHRKPEIEVPTYRFLNGTWGKLDEAGRMEMFDYAHLTHKSIFCNIGIQQIETQLEEISEPGPRLFSMSFDESTGAEFYCWSKELQRVYDAVAFKLGEFIDSVIDELKLAPNER